MNTIVIDCDGPLVDLNSAWYSYLEAITGITVPKKPLMDYDLTTYFKPELEYEGVTGFEFLGMEGIYDNLEPVEGSIQALQGLKDLGYTLVCISVETGLHGASKRRFLSKYFPMLDAVFLCDKGTKHYVPCEYIIEDRFQEVVNHPKETTALICRTPYMSKVPINCPYGLFNTWQEIEDYIYWKHLEKQEEGL